MNSEYPEYLTKRYGVMCSRNCLGPLEVKGNITMSGKTIFEGDFLVYVGPDAKTWVCLKLDGLSLPLIRAFAEWKDAAIAVGGMTGDGGRLVLNRCAVANISMKSNSGKLSVKSSGLHIDAGNDLKAMVTLLGFDSLDVTYFEPVDLNQLSVSYVLINSLLPGRMGTITSSAFTWSFSHFNGFHKEWSDDLESGVARYLPVSVVESNLPHSDLLPKADAEMEDICWLTSMCVGVSTTWCMRLVKCAGKIVRLTVENKCPSTDAAGKNKYNMFSGLGSEYTRNFVISALPNFQRYKSELKLDLAINYLELARHQKVVELQIATLVLRLELLTFQCCLKAGCKPDELEDKNLVNKLKYLRKTFRFIEKKFTEDSLRKDIRNPLLHSGQIPLMTYEELAEWADGLYNLTVRMLFCVLGYQGQYRDFSNSNALVDAPGEKFS